GPKHVPGMTVAVQADRLKASHALEAIADSLQGEGGDCPTCVQQVRCDQVRLEQPAPRLVAEALDVEGRAHGESRDRADCMNPSDEAPDPPEHFFVLELRRPAAAPGIDR